MDLFNRPDVRTLRDAFQERRSRVDREFGGLSETAIHWNPAPGRWSVAECLHHLCRTGFTWADHLGPILFGALRHGIHAGGPYRPGPVAHWVIRSMEDGSRRLKTSSTFQPRDTASLTRDDLLRAFTALGDSWEGTLLRASRLDLSRLRTGSPAARLVVLPVGTWLYALSTHEDRHLAQARRVLDESGFPG